ncbi:MAG TPA: metallophosphoesterase [Myxococcaceae bacterium]|nr:metallophosphoesterase [Myxococcaceae bacterium]
MEPLLQLVHVSDLHFRQRHGPSPVGARSVGQRTPSRDSVFQGMEGHDPQALGPLVRSIRDRVGPSRSAFRHGTFLVVTGDLATLGDAGSAESAERLVADIAAQAGLPAPLVVYGNHDVWPGSLPLFAGADADLDARRSALRAKPLHAADRPARALQAGPFSLWYLDTVRHGRFENTLALGHIGADRYWEKDRQLRPQLDALAAAATQSELRIALTHHPVLQPSRWRPWKGLRNWAEMERGLSAADPAGGRHRLVRVVLSGHTHALYPPLGRLRADIATRNARQVHAQLVVGTATQLRHGDHQGTVEADLEQHHCWQLLRFFEEPEGRLVLERIVFVRSGSVVPLYAPATIGADPRRTAERAYL